MSGSSLKPFISYNSYHHDLLYLIYHIIMAFHDLQSPTQIISKNIVFAATAFQFDKVSCQTGEGSARYFFILVSPE